MRPEPVGREERAFDVRADHARERAVRRHRPHRLDDRALGRGDERRLIRRDAAFEQRSSGDVVVARGGGEEVDAAVAVHLQVYEAGHCDPSARAAGEADVDDRPVDNLDVALNELAAHQCSLNIKPHASAPLTEPPATSSRSFAVAGSTPASSETSATLASPPAAARAASTSSSGLPLASTMFRRARSRNFAFSGTTPTIRPAYVRPRRIIAAVEIVFRMSFCAVPAFSRV